ncbi:MAG TPA: PEP-utilizing enzyme, partial [Myxococcota bacterium]|nr:PEP-utilizing enzyme [Myxococcota bacterium]
IFGIVRHLMRGVGINLARLGAIEHERDVFFLTVDEIFAYVEGRSLTTSMAPLVRARQAEFARFEASPEPPQRLVTYGASTASMAWPQVLADGDLLRDERPTSTDPDVLLGTPCCPGIIEGTVRVASGLEDTHHLDGEILVTSRTDPGWVPLYPACAGLLIERGSLLSHSAVVARELGLPTIVGIGGGLMHRLKTGMRVRVDAGRGEVRILS